MDLLRAVPILTVPDVDAAIKEYSDLLGLEVLMNPGWVATLGTSGGAQFSVMDIDQSAKCNPQLFHQRRRRLRKFRMGGALPLRPAPGTKGGHGPYSLA